MFGRLKDWRRVAARYDRCPTAFFSAIALAATVIFWLRSVIPHPNATRPASENRSCVIFSGPVSG